MASSGLGRGGVWGCFCLVIVLNVLILQDTTTAQGKKRTEVSGREKGTYHALRMRKRCSVVICRF